MTRSKPFPRRIALSRLVPLLIDLIGEAGEMRRPKYEVLVTDRHRGLVGDSTLDVVYAQVITEGPTRVRLRLLDGVPVRPVHLSKEIKEAWPERRAAPNTLQVGTSIASR